MAKKSREEEGLFGSDKYEDSCASSSSSSSSSTLRSLSLTHEGGDGDENPFLPLRAHLSSSQPPFSPFRIRHSEISLYSPTTAAIGLGS